MEEINNNMIKRDSKGRFVKGTSSPKGMSGKKQSKEWKEKQSKRLKEQYESGKRKSVMFGKPAWNRGKKTPKLIKLKISKTMSGRRSSVKTEFKIGNQNKNFKKDWSNQKGGNHWNWKGGITPELMKLRNSSMYKIWRELVFLRDNFTCQNLNCEYCKNKPGVYLHAHHMKSFAKYPRLRFKVNNGITYCKNYHAKFEYQLRNGTALIIG